MKHSELPWKIKEYETSFHTHMTEIYSNDKFKSCLYSSAIDNPGDGAMEISKEDATFIVEACNNYEALQERVKELEEALYKICDHKNEADKMYLYAEKAEALLSKEESHV